MAESVESSHTDSKAHPAPISDSTSTSQGGSRGADTPPAPSIPLPAPASTVSSVESHSAERKDSNSVVSNSNHVIESPSSSSLPVATQASLPEVASSHPIPSTSPANTSQSPPKETISTSQELQISPLEMEIIDAIEKQAAKDATEAAKQQMERSKYATEKAPLITEIKRYYPVIVEVKPKKEKKKKKVKDKKVHPEAAAVEEIHAKAKEKWKKVGEHLHDLETGHVTDESDDEMPGVTRKNNRNTIMQMSAKEGGPALNKLRSPQNHLARRPSALEQATINLLFRKVPRSIDKLSKYLPTYNDDVLESISEIIFKPYPFTLKMFAYILLILQFLSLLALVMSLAECPEEKIGWSIMAGIPLCCGYGETDIDTSMNT